MTATGSTTPPPAVSVRRYGLGGLTGSPIAVAIVAVVLVASLGVPLLRNGYDENLIRGVLMFATMALGWNLIGGYTGYVSFGNVVYFGVGAYVSVALASGHIDNVWIAIVVSIVVNGILAVLLGLPILRLKGHYFGIATLACSLAVGEIIANVDALGGGSGATLHQSSLYSQYFYAMWACCAASFVATWCISRSKFGYALVAIRENEDAAAVLGVHPTFYKVGAWAISAMMAGSVGAVFSFAQGSIDPPTAFGIDYNVFPIVMTILGGAGTVAGPVVGASLLSIVQETLWDHFPREHNLFLGAVIVFVVVFLPRGLLQKGGWRGFLASLRAYRA